MIPKHIPITNRRRRVFINKWRVSQRWSHLEPRTHISIVVVAVSRREFYYLRGGRAAVSL